MNEDKKSLLFMVGIIVACFVFPPLGALLMAVAILMLIISILTGK